MFVNSASAIRSQAVSLRLNSKTGHGIQIHSPMIARKRETVIAMASTDSMEASVDGEGDQSKDKEAKVEVQNLPLESKLELELERKMKMKIAKKIRLRRKRLVRKRQLRKKGRWPPSKMKKNKNI